MLRVQLVARRASAPWIHVSVSCVMGVRVFLRDEISHCQRCVCVFYFRLIRGSVDLFLSWSFFFFFWWLEVRET